MREITIKSKLPDVGTTIFTVMSQMALEHNAINLSQGFPDFNAPPELLDLVSKFMNEGKNQYSPMTGVPSLREQIKKKVDQLYGCQISGDDEITVTSGATDALFTAITACIHPGDEVIMFDPAYDSYEPAVTLNGGSSIHIPLTEGNYQIDWQRVKDKITHKTRLIIINSPHNPTGSVLAEEDLKTLTELTRDTNIYILSDEVYEHIIFDGVQHQSVLSYPELRSRAFVVSSFGKTYHATGWKIGYCIAPPNLSKEFRKVHQFVSFCSITPNQLALAEYMERRPEHTSELSGFYQKKRDLFCNLLADTNFTFTPAQGTYFQLANYERISSMDDISFSEYLTRKTGVAVIPVSVFYDKSPQTRVIRFCFAKEETTLRQAAEKLRGLEQKMD
ncbi:MAG: pyridoxal phosphate-dependent aminotransferase [Proteobacteria bacterium]|nr:pyridoxal phosphate-dependent aminotransferase [Pseudomonadota bacterium]